MQYSVYSKNICRRLSESIMWQNVAAVQPPVLVLKQAAFTPFESDCFPHSVWELAANACGTASSAGNGKRGDWFY